jgi:hypothetical protein
MAYLLLDGLIDNDPETVTQETDGAAPQSIISTEEFDSKMMMTVRMG